MTERTWCFSPLFPLTLFSEFMASHSHQHPPLHLHLQTSCSLMFGFFLINFILFLTSSNRSPLLSQRENHPGGLWTCWLLPVSMFSTFAYLIPSPHSQEMFLCRSHCDGDHTSLVLSHHSGQWFPNCVFLCSKQVFTFPPHQHPNTESDGSSFTTICRLLLLTNSQTFDFANCQMLR